MAVTGQRIEVAKLLSVIWIIRTSYRFDQQNQLYLMGSGA